MALRPTYDVIISKVAATNDAHTLEWALAKLRNVTTISQTDVDLSACVAIVAVPRWLSMANIRLNLGPEFTINESLPPNY